MSFHATPGAILTPSGKSLGKRTTESRKRRGVILGIEMAIPAGAARRIGEGSLHVRQRNRERISLVDVDSIC